jgi:hypothetical protein
MPLSNRPPTLRILSLGAGVQSTTMALLAAHGEIGPMPDAAIFADTGSEPAPTYEHLRWLMSPNVLPFPVHVVGKATSLHADLMRGTNSGGRRRYAAIPAFLSRPGEREGMGRRQCTKEYKIEPLLKKQRELAGFAPRQRIPAGAVEVWIGISRDEALRMKPSRNAWSVHRWPLIERGMTRPTASGGSPSAATRSRRRAPARSARSAATASGARCATRTRPAGSRRSRSTRRSAVRRAATRAT